MSSTTSGASTVPLLPDYAPVPPSSLGPPLNEQGYYVGRVERNLFWVTDGTYQSAFLATNEGIVLFDAPPTIGHNLRRAVTQSPRPKASATPSRISSTPITTRTT